MYGNPERRKIGIRRDLNDLVRDDAGHLSPTKIGVLIGQWLAVKLIIENGTAIIANWDSLTVLFSVLVAPGMFIKLVNMKYGSPDAGVITTTTNTDTQSQSRAVEKVRKK